MATTRFLCNCGALLNECDKCFHGAHQFLECNANEGNISQLLFHRKLLKDFILRINKAKNQITQVLITAQSNIIFHIKKLDAICKTENTMPELTNPIEKIIDSRLFKFTQLIDSIIKQAQKLGNKSTSITSLFVSSDQYVMNHAKLLSQITKLNNNLSQFSDENSSNDKSTIAYFKSAIKIIHDLPTEPHLYMRIGEKHNLLGNNAKCFKYYIKAKDACNQLFTDYETEISKRYLKIAKRHKINKQISEAIRFYKKSIAIKSKLGQSPKLLGVLYMIVGNLYDESNEQANAIESYNKALQLAISSHGHISLRVGDIKYNIGRSYQILGDYNAAVPCYQQALSNYTWHYGTKNHKDIATTNFALGRLFSLLNLSPQALKYYLKSAKIKEIIMSTNDKEMAHLNNEIGELYLRNNKNREAVFYLQNAKDLFMQLGNESFESKRPELAIEFYEKAREIIVDKFSSLSLDAAFIIFRMGKAYYFIGEYKEAEDYFQKSLSIYNCLPTTESYSDESREIHQYLDLTHAALGISKQ